MCRWRLFNALRRYEYTYAMTVNDLFGAIHATVANFDGVPVEDFPKFVILKIFRSL